MFGDYAGIGIGVILGLAYSLGWRPGWIVATQVATAGALIGTNGPMIALGVTDPADLWLALPLATTPTLPGGAVRLGT